MSQWNGGAESEEPSEPTQPSEPSQPTQPTQPPAAGSAIRGADGAADVFAFRPGDGWAEGGPLSVENFEPGRDALDVEAHALGGATYQPWTFDTAEGQVVQWSWAEKESVLLRGVHGIAMEELLHPSGAAAPPAEEPPAEEPPVGPAPEARTGTGGADLFDAGAAGGVFAGGGGRDLFVLDAGDGRVTVTDFAPGTDKLVLVGFDAAEVATAQATEGAAAGLLVSYGGQDGGAVFLAGVDALAHRDLVFA